MGSRSVVRVHQAKEMRAALAAALVLTKMVGTTPVAVVALAVRQMYGPPALALQILFLEQASHTLPVEGERN